MSASKVVSTDNAPAAIGPYSQAIAAGGLLFCSGQLGLDPATKAMVPGGVQEQTRQALKNLRAVLEAGGSSLAAVVKATVYLADMDDFKAVNAIYAESFASNPPARVAIEVSRMPLDARVEIDAIAVLGQPYCWRPPLSLGFAPALWL